MGLRTWRRIIIPTPWFVLGFFLFARLDVDRAHVGVRVISGPWPRIPRVCADTWWSHVRRCNSKPALAGFVHPMAWFILALVGFAPMAVEMNRLNVVPTTRPAVARVTWAVLPYTIMASRTAETPWSGTWDVGFGGVRGRLPP